ncbi:MAG TPA: choice-of-anchor D domain-containing protein [Thermoanaerobaculia bacterium]|jgi:hypothetical protein|nr:choice-of-anchor D domain-containing protein [Thermoanaerobaculia bacterium]
MRRAILACALLLLSALSAVTAARSQSISVFTHTTIVPGQQAMAECGTIMNDVNTVARYPYVQSQCSLWRQIQGTSDGVMIGAFNCPAGTDSRCRSTYPTAPGETYAASNNHWLGFYNNVPALCNGYYDPYRYLINPIPRFVESGTLGVRTPYGCWADPEGLIATSYSDDVTTFAIFPTAVTLAPGKQISFSAVGQVPLWSVIQGPGTIDSSGTYTAPSSVSGTQTAVVKGCNTFNGADCATANITLQNPVLTVSPSGQEVLPQGTLTLKATLTPNTFPQTVTWKVTPTGAGTISAAGVYTAPTNDQLPGTVQLTAEACSTVSPTVCGTTTFTVPKVDITVTGPSAFLATPGSTLTLGANAIGPVTSQEVTWLPSAGTLTLIGFNTIRYTPPAITAAQTVTFNVCLRSSPGTCGKPDYSLVLVPPVAIASAGTWTAGTTSAVTITGTGFGTAPAVGLSDPGIPFTIASRNNTSIVLNVTLPVSAGGRSLTVTVQNTTAGLTSAASAGVVVAKAVLAMTPTSATLRESQSASFSTTCTAGGSACTGSNPVSWSTTLGTITPTGATTAQYTAPASVASTTTGTIKACWSVAPEQCATAQVTVNPLTVAVTPATANVNGCSTRQLTAQVTNATVTTVTWSIASGGGAVDTNGLYTAPCPVTAQSTVQVKACSTENTQKCGTAQLTLVPVSVDVTPKTVSVAPGGSQQFAAVVQGASNTTVTWSISGNGGIDANGLYTAPATLPAVTAVTVTATSKADNTTKGTAQITLVSASAVLTPSTLTFAAQDVGTTSAAQTVTLSNQGTASFSLTGITTTGDFTQTSNCGAALAPGASCAVNVQFAPTANGSRTGTLRVADTAPGSPHIATLSGTGRGPAASLSPLSLDFGGQRAGFATAAKTVTLTNTGAGPMAISSIAVDGEFTQTNACPTSLAAGASCIISVKFNPAAASLGMLTGTLRVYDNAAGSPHAASVQGSVLGGFHDYATCTGSSGWAWDSARPNTPINVYIFEGSNLLATVLADKYRSDLASGGFGNGYHAFDWPMLASLRDGLSHTLTIRFSSDPSSLPIPGSPKSLTCTPAPSYQGNHDIASCQGLAGWGWDSTQPNTAITLYVFQGTQYLGSVLANQFRQDLVNAGIGNGIHGFSWPIPSSLVDGQSHSLTVRFGSSSSSTALTSSPKSINCAPAPAATTSIAWIQPAESSWGPAGTLTAAGYAEGGTGGVQLFWRERSSAGVWSGWSSVAYQPAPAGDTTWSNTISSGSPTDKCHWFDAYVKYSGVTSATFHYTGASGCP